VSRRPTDRESDGGDSRVQPEASFLLCASSNGAETRCAVTAGDHRAEWVGSVVVVRVSGAIDMLTAPALTEKVREVVAQSPTAVIIDLTDVEFLASAGMQVLVNTHNEVTPAIRFAVVADGPATSRPLKITGLTDLITLFPTLDGALDHVAS
jgi:anti-anti-sigma factor